MESKSDDNNERVRPKISFLDSILESLPNDMTMIDLSDDDATDDMDIYNESDDANWPELSYANLVPEAEVKENIIMEETDRQIINTSDGIIHVMLRSPCCGNLSPYTCAICKSKFCGKHFADHWKNCLDGKQTKITSYFQKN